MDGSGIGEAVLKSAVVMELRSPESPLVKE
jgi:hypothetical protein